MGLFLGHLRIFRLMTWGIDTVASGADDRLSHLLHQPPIPALAAALTGWALRHATAQDFEGRGERQSPGVELLRSGDVIDQTRTRTWAKSRP